MENMTDPRQGLPEADFGGREDLRGGGSGGGGGGGGGVFPGIGEDPLVDNVDWVYDMAWYGEAVRDDGFICEEHPAKLSSDGVWEKMIYNEHGLRVWQYRLPNLEMVIVLVFILWQFFNILFRKMGLKTPKFTSMMLVSFFFFFSSLFVQILIIICS